MLSDLDPKSYMASYLDPDMLESDVHGLDKGLTRSQPNRLASAKFLVCFNFQSTSMSLKVGENVVYVSNSLDPDDTPSHSASHLYPSCLHMALVVIGGLRVNP